MPHITVQSGINSQCSSNMSYTVHRSSDEGVANQDPMNTQLDLSASELGLNANC